MAVVSPMSPYRDTAILYRKAGWLGTLYLPYKKKNPPPTGFTGHKAGYPTPDDIKQWRNSGKRQNICIRLAGVDDDTEIIGIDVDHYASGDKNKRGGDQLSTLEERLGDLPDTWISSARTDGRSGIRYFRVPRGMAFRGQVEKDIECISKGYRFAVVWPSVHPEQGTYWWFPPGVTPDADGKKVWNGVLPQARDLPLLPEPWLDHLTAGKMRAEIDDRIDMDSTVSEIDEWADDTLPGDETTEMCDRMKKKVELHKKKISSEATSHDKIVNAHFNLIKLAQEGHRGWIQALNEIEKFWVEDVIARDKRGQQELVSEVWRSRTNALRKIKAICDENINLGAAPCLLSCDQTGECGTTGADSGGSGDGSGGDTPPPHDPLDGIPRGQIKPIDEYDTNDLGNARHLRDTFAPVSGGSSIRWVDGYGWIVWRDREGGRWQRDETGHDIVFQMWEHVYERQKNYVETALRPVFEVERQNAINAGLPMSGANAPVALIAARNKLVKWEKFVENNGNQGKTETCLKRLKGLSGIPLEVDALDQNKLLLGVANGVLELDSEDVRVRPAQPSDYVTLNTNVPYEEPHERASEIWENYLETFLPDPELRKSAQIALGYCLLGGNREKKIIVLIGQPNTGKSTMINTVEAALGEYAQTVGAGVFQQAKFNEDLVAALNKRIIICSEFDDEKLSASVIKRMTGDSDKVSSPIKFSMKTRSANPLFVPILATNSVPKITGADKALENRLYPIPFEVVPRKIDTKASSIVKTTCKVACLKWLVEGYLEYKRIGGIPTNEYIRETTRRLMSEMDEVSAFANDVLISHSNRELLSVRWQDSPEWCVKSANLYDRFESWWTENRMPERERPSVKKFATRLQSLGYRVEQVRPTGLASARYWLGVKMVAKRSTVVVGRFQTEVEAANVKQSAQRQTTSNTKTPDQD